MRASSKKVSEYYQEIPQFTTAVQPMAPWTRATEHLQYQDICKTITAKPPAPFLFKIIAKLDRTQSNVYQNKDTHRIPSNNGKYTQQ